MSFKKRGMSLPNALMFIMVTGGMTVSAVSLTTHMDKMAMRGLHKAQAVALAESGANDLYVKVYRQMRLDGTFPTDSGEVSVSSTMSGDTKVAGTYRARVANVESSQTTLPNGDVKVDYTFRIDSTGVAPNGVDSLVSMAFTGSLTRAGSTGGTRGGSNYSFGHGAILSNTRVRMISNGGIRTLDSGRRGHILGNDGLEWNRKDGQKQQNFNPNVLEIQGQYQVAGIPAWEQSVSPAGMGNSNGSRNYRAVNPDNGATIAEITKLPARRQFPTESQVKDWQESWAGAAKSGSNFNRSISSSDVAQRSGDQWRIIQAPAYIDGDLDVVNGQVLRLMPSDGTNSKTFNNVIYVSGNVRNLGMLYNLGVTFVIQGTYSDGPSAEYRIDGQGSPWKDDTTRLQNANLISLSRSSAAMTFSTDATTRYGLVYAARGGIRVTGNLEMRDTVLISGGQQFADGNQIGVDIQPRGDNSFVVGYNAALGGERPGFSGAPPVPQNGDGTTSAIKVAFLPGPPSHWVQIR